MNKILICAMFLLSSSVSFAQDYVYKAKEIGGIKISVNKSALNISSNAKKEISVDVFPESARERVKVFLNDDGYLNIELSDFSDENVKLNIDIPRSKNIIELKALDSSVEIAKIKGSLDMDVEGGSLEIINFVGNFNLNVSRDTKVKAEGIFKDFVINASEADIFVKMRSIPSLYKYIVKGNAELILKLPMKYQKARLKIDKKDFDGNLNIQ